MKPNRNPSPRRAGNAALGSHRPAALADGEEIQAMRQIDPANRELVRYAVPFCRAHARELGAVALQAVRAGRVDNAADLARYAASWALRALDYAQEPAA